MQKEIKTPGPLLNDAGHLRETGYATSLLLAYDRAHIKANPLRIKEWDYYIVTNGRFAVALTVADNSYMGLSSVSLLDFEKVWEKTASVMSLLPMGKTLLPASSESGTTRFENKHAAFTFTCEGKQRHLTCHYPNFKDGMDFSCDISLTDFPRDTMVIATPFSGNPKAFYYNQKINCMRASGEAKLGETVYRFEPDTAFGTLDWGRGVWTYSNTWYWGSASGLAGGVPFGFNLGYGFGDTSAASENMLFYGGAAHKLEDVTFHIPTDAAGREEFTKPWTFTSTDGRFEMDFLPILDRASKTSLLLISSDQHQVFGRFTGRAVLDDGTVLQIKELPGFAEKVINRW